MERSLHSINNAASSAFRTAATDNFGVLAGARFAAVPALEAAPDVPQEIPSRTSATLTLYRRAPQNLRHRVATAAVHFGALVAADLLALALLMGLYVGMRDLAWLGVSISDFVGKIVPTGFINAGQYAAALLVGLLVTGNYSYGDGRREPARLLAGCALATGLAFWGILWERSAPVVLLEYALVTGVVWVTLVGDRVGVDVLLQKYAPRSLVAPRTVLIGSQQECEALHAARIFGWERDYTYVGYVDAGPKAGRGALGTVGELPTILDRHEVHWVVLASLISEREFRAVIDAAASVGCKLFAAPRWLVHGQFEPKMVWRRGHGLLELTPRAALPLADTLEHAPDSLYVRFGKRVLDVIGAMAGIAIGWLPALIAAVAMRLESPGPVFILQPRVGRGGRIFEIVKLRSMVADAERDGEAKWAGVADDRITPVGRWVRRLRLDELPQFLNVLLGQMSLVGPRPERPELHDKIVDVHPEFAIRVAVKPGITGLAQIYNGYADSVDSSRRKLEYDRRYLANISLAFDLSLLIKTVKVVLTGRGSR